MAKLTDRCAVCSGSLDTGRHSQIPLPLILLREVPVRDPMGRNSVGCIVTHDKRHTLAQLAAFFRIMGVMNIWFVALNTSIQYKNRSLIKLVMASARGCEPDSGVPSSR